MSPAWNRGIKKAVRTAAQLIAGGALTAAVNMVADGLSPNAKVYVLAAWTVAIALAQNYAEAAGRIPALLPSPGLVPSAATVTRAAGTVETTVEQIGGAVGEVSGVVESVTGELLGEVVDVDRTDDLGDG